MSSRTLSFEYEEEDGFEIFRDGKMFLVTGTCEGKYTASYYPATRWEPEEESFEQDSFDCEVGVILDDEGNVVELELTDDENRSFEEHMSNKLEEVARESDAWTEEE